jgi:TolB-like protein
MGLIAELKRRNVFRVGVAYLVLGWVVIQVTDTVAPALNLPEWTLALVTWIGIIGFPFAVFFAWAFELTPQGIKREHEVDRSQSVTNHTGRKLDFAVIGLLVIALALVVWDSYLSESSEESLVSDVSAVAVEPAQVEKTSSSIAVLPFVNMSDDKDYFADGLSEELLNLLAKIPGLKVAGRTSSFAFKGRNEDLREIGQALNVGTVLEGSVRRSGDRLRVTAQLIKVDDGFHIWSNAYDREIADIFDIQDDLARAITEALRLHLSSAENRPTDNAEAYAIYLEALAMHDVMTGDISEVLALLNRAITLDPGFAKAYELKAMTYWMVGGWTMDSTEAQRLVFEAAAAALTLDPSLVVARSFATTSRLENWNWTDDIAALEEAARAAPNDVRVLNSLAYDLTQSGYFEEALVYARREIELDPLSAQGSARVANALSALGRREEAHEHWRKGYELGNVESLSFAAVDLLASGEYEAAIDRRPARHFLTIRSMPWLPRLAITQRKFLRTGIFWRLDTWMNSGPSLSRSKVSPTLDGQMQISWNTIARCFLHQAACVIRPMCLSRKERL